ncbi:hypothetical protein D3C79_1025640 [compost metagenome]
MAFKNVDFPAPFGPIMAARWPVGTVTQAFSNTVFLSYATERFSTVNAYIFFTYFNASTIVSMLC